MHLSPADDPLSGSVSPRRVGSDAVCGRSDLFVAIVCAIGFTFDLSEISFGAALSGVFSTPPYSIPAGQLSWLLASIYIGAILGPLFMGVFADRYGRRSALTVTLLFLAATSLASAIAPGIVALSILRGLSGVALGAYPPLMITYLTDILPARLRGRLIMITVAIAYLGPPATIFLMRWLTPLAPWGLAGWRWVIGIDGIGALLAGIAFRYLPESTAWYEASESLAESAPNPSRAASESLAMGLPNPSPKASESLASGSPNPSRAASESLATGSPNSSREATESVASVSRHPWPEAAKSPAAGSLYSLRNAGLVTGLSFLAPWATVSFPLLTAAFLVNKGFNLADTLLYVGVSTFGPFLGSGLVALIADRFERRTSLVACSLGMAAAAIGFYASDRAAWLMLTSFAFNLCVALYMPALNTYVAELFAARARGRATSWAWSANRVAAAAVPLMMLPWLHHGGEGLVFMVIVGTLAATVLLIVAFGPPGNAGRPVC